MRKRRISTQTSGVVSVATNSDLSCPAQAGHPVIASAGFQLRIRWLLGRPPSRTMTAESHCSGRVAMFRAFTRPAVMALGLALVALLALAARAQADEPFYKGKRL